MNINKENKKLFEVNISMTEFMTKEEESFYSLNLATARAIFSPSKRGLRLDDMRLRIMQELSDLNDEIKRLKYKKSRKDFLNKIRIWTLDDGLSIMKGLYIRNSTDSELFLDAEMLSFMTKEEAEKYSKNLIRIRNFFEFIEDDHDPKELKDWILGVG